MLRLLGLLGGLSVALDLGTGAPLEESLRRCVVATRVARELGRTDDEVRDLMYAALLEHLGCTAYTHELALAFGDDIATVRAGFLSNPASPVDLVTTFVPMVSEATGRSRARTLAAALRSGRKVDAVGPVATCEVARSSAGRLGLPTTVQESLAHATAMWDGSGKPAVAGDAIPLLTRIMHVASVATMFTLVNGPARAVEEVRRRAGTQLDPDLAGVFDAGMLDGVADLDGCEAVLDLEPDPVRLVDPAELEPVACAFGDLADLKSPWLQGHSAAVAELAGAAAEGPNEARTLRIAGHLHDLGRIGVSSRIWGKTAPLSASERAQVELHPWHTDQILSRVPALAEVAEIASAHHERLDGSGYHRRAVAVQLSRMARLLAAADRFQGLREDRPHRPALTASAASAELNADARSGRLDADAVAAVLAAAGAPARARRPRPAGLTERQVDVLRLMAAGRSNKQIATALVISARTAEHHVQDIYGRIGVSTRAGAALFAMEHGLLERPGKDG